MDIYGTAGTQDELNGVCEFLVQAPNEDKEGFDMLVELVSEAFVQVKDDLNG